MSATIETQPAAEATTAPGVITVDARSQLIPAPDGPRPIDTPVVLEVKDLKAHFFLREGTVRAVDGVSYKLHRGRTLGIVGESGCGQSVIAQAVLGIVPRPG